MNNYDLLMAFFNVFASVPDNFQSLIQGFLEEIETQHHKLPRSVEIISHSQFAGWVQQSRNFEKFFTYVSKKDRQYETWIREKRHLPKTQGITFVNREDEIRTLLDAAEANKYFLIASPPGFGATYLIDKIAERLQEQVYNEYQGWEYVQVQIRSEEGLRKVLELIAGQLGMSSFDEWEKSSEDLCELFLQWYRIFRNTPNHIPPKGVYFLIDFQGRPNGSIFQSLVKDILPGIIDFHKTIKTRVILIGRFVTNHQIKWRQNSLPFAEYPSSLSPLHFKYVQETVEQYLPASHYDAHERSDIASHIFYLTGGHPGSMATILKEFRNRGWTAKRFFAKGRKKRIWVDFVSNNVKNVYTELEKFDLQSNTISRDSLREIFEQLVIFRIIPRRALIECANSESEKEAVDIKPIHLRSVLQDTYMLMPVNGLLQDNIHRRLILLSLGITQRENLHSILMWGLKVTKAEIIHSERPARWTLEWLYQRLLLAINTHLIDDESEREKLKQLFFNDILDELYDIYDTRWTDVYTENDRPLEDLTYLVEAVKETAEQAEFSFLLNYFLREQTYTDQPFQDLQRRLDEWKNQEEKRNESEYQIN